MKICIYISLLYLCLIGCQYKKTNSFAVNNEIFFNFDMYQKCVVSVQIVTKNNDLFGASGFFVAEDLIITNQHILEDNTKSIWIHWDSNLQKKPTEAFVVFSDKKNDLLLLKVKIKNHSYIDIMQKSKFNIGKDVIVLGFPEATQEIGFSTLHVFKGAIAAKQVNLTSKFSRLILDVNIMQGNSGGPVIDARNGKVIGLVSSLIFDVIETENHSQIEGKSVGIAISIKALYQFFSDYENN